MVCYKPVINYFETPAINRLKIILVFLITSRQGDMEGSSCIELCYHYIFIVITHSQMLRNFEMVDAATSSSLLLEAISLR